MIKAAIGIQVPPGFCLYRRSMWVQGCCRGRRCWCRATACFVRTTAALVAVPAARERRRRVGWLWAHCQVVMRAAAAAEAALLPLLLGRWPWEHRCLEVVAWLAVGMVATRAGGVSIRGGALLLQMAVAVGERDVAGGGWGSGGRSNSRWFGLGDLLRGLRRGAEFGPDGKAICTACRQHGQCSAGGQDVGAGSGGGAGRLGRVGTLRLESCA